MKRYTYTLPLDWSWDTGATKRTMNLFLLLKGISQIFFQSRRSSATDPRLSERRRTAWSVASPLIFRSCIGMCTVAASNSPALQRPERRRISSITPTEWGYALDIVSNNLYLCLRVRDMNLLEGRILWTDRRTLSSLAQARGFVLRSNNCHEIVRCFRCVLFPGSVDICNSHTVLCNRQPDT